MLMITEGAHWTYPADIDRHAYEKYNLLIEQMKENESVTIAAKLSNSY